VAQKVTELLEEYVSVAPLAHLVERLYAEQKVWVQILHGIAKISSRQVVKASTNPRPAREPRPSEPARPQTVRRVSTQAGSANPR
jgi:hypothetical protein